MPSGIDDEGETSRFSASIPPDEKFERVKNVDFTADSYKAAAVLGLGNIFTTVDSLHDYQEMATAMGFPEVQLYHTDRWATDVEFGRQVLNGVNPVIIRKISSLPDNFPVTDDMLKGLLCGTLKQEMKVS